MATWQRDAAQLRARTVRFMDSMKTDDEMAPSAEQCVRECIEILSEHVNNKNFQKHLDRGIPLNDADLCLTRSEDGSIAVVEAEDNAPPRTLTPAEIAEKYGAAKFYELLYATIDRLATHYEIRVNQNAAIHEFMTKRREVEAASTAVKQSA